jgi:hypothetical protein
MPGSPRCFVQPKHTTFAQNDRKPTRLWVSSNVSQRRVKAWLVSKTALANFAGESRSSKEVVSCSIPRNSATWPSWFFASFRGIPRLSVTRNVFPPTPKRTRYPITMTILKIILPHLWADKDDANIHAAFCICCDWTDSYSTLPDSSTYIPCRQAVTLHLTHIKRCPDNALIPDLHHINI